MKNLFLLIVLCTAIFLPQTIFSQNHPKTIDKQLEASKLFSNEDYAPALKIFLDLDTIHEHNINYDFQIAICYLHIYKHGKALDYIEKCKNKEDEHGEVLNYYIAKIYQLETHLDSSILFYNKYLTALNNTKNKSKTIVPEVEYEIQMCLNAKEAIKNSKPVEITNPFSSLNSPYNEYGAQLSGDEKTLIFTSGRPSSTGGTYDSNDGTYFDDIYISHFIDSSWSEPVSISDNINTEHHEASVALSHDGHKLIFYRYSSNGLLSESGDLYYSEYKNNAWTTPIHFDKPINTKNWEPSACFSLDDKEIFFVSDRKGGFGGTDIYRVKKNKNGKWEKAQNLGAEINTALNDDAPFLHPDGKTFYFSSQGHQSIGGYDFFKAVISDNNTSFKNIENLGYPINTTGDDTDFTISSNGQHLYFSSDRPEGKGNKDLFIAYLSYIEKDILQLTGYVTDQSNKEAIDATITISGLDNNGNTINRISSSNLSLEGKFIILLNEGYKYTITFESNGYINESIKLDTSLLKGFNKEEQFVVLQKQ